MFGFHPFGTHSIGNTQPFVDVQTTTNVVTASQGTAVPEMVPVTSDGLTSPTGDRVWPVPVDGSSAARARAQPKPRRAGGESS